MEEKQDGKKQKILKWLKIIFLALVVIFLTKYFKNNIAEIKALNFKVDWKVFAISMLFYFAYKVSLASLWHYITYLNESAIKYGDAITAYLYSILGKYIPGRYLC